MSAVAPSLQQPFAAALLDPALAPPPGLRAWNGSRVQRRFDVHRNNVVTSLIDAMADTFPVVQALVGPEFFRAAAAVFVRATPPRSPLLFRYGADFAGFLEAFEPAQGLPYLADVARLEFARVQAFHAADAEPIQPQALSSAFGEANAVGALRMRMHPSLRLLESRHPAASIWAAHQGRGALEDVDLARGECVLVLRPRLDVLVVPCDRATLLFARALQGGSDLAGAVAAAAGADLVLPATLARLLAHGAFAGIQRTEGEIA